MQALPPIAPPAEVSRLAEVVVWFLQHHLLVQLHTYITLALGPNIIGCSLEDPLRVTIWICFQIFIYLFV